MLLSHDRPRIPSGLRIYPILGSIAAHALFFLWLFAAPLPARHNAYDQMIKPNETHLVWYNFKRKLPDVSPAKRAENKPLRAETLASQSIVSSPLNAPRAPQVIFHPVPQLKPQPPVPLPNMIALSAPPPPQRQFTPPKSVESRRALPQAVEPAAAPELKASVTAPQLFNLPKPFLPPVERARKLTAHIQTADAPQLAPTKSATTSNTEQTLRQASTTLAFRPQAKPSLTASVGNLPDAPALSNASSSTANIAVVGLNPIDNPNVRLPEGSSRAQFSAGPKLNPDGASATGKFSGITVPDLTVRGGGHDAEPNLIARTMSPSYNAPSSIQAARAAVRNTSPHSAIEELGRPSGTRVSGSPDPRFMGRQVFSVAIQSPNLTSHQGSWLMWYADRSETNYHEIISAPEPLHKVDPKYIATAVEEKIEGTVRLAFVISHDGRVYGIETVKGIDDRLDRSAREALEKWRFSPALREGQPIDVDALVEIPFRLAPMEPK